MKGWFALGVGGLLSLLDFSGCLRSKDGETMRRIPTDVMVPASLAALPSLAPNQRITQTELADVVKKANLRGDDLQELFEAGEGLKVCGIFLHGREALASWALMRKIAEKTGYYPLLLGDEQAVQRRVQDIKERQMTAAEILNRAQTLDPIRWIEDRASKDPGGYADGKEVSGKDDGPAHEFTIPFSLPGQKPLPRVCLAFLPTIRPWEIPALLSFGDWNECPPPDVHVGLMKHWYEQYGAEFVGVTEDVIEMRVTQPPADPSAAQTLAREQFLYCSDIVHQGVGTTRALASLLQGGTAWYFWWD